MSDKSEPAFPGGLDGERKPWNDGMSLRDYFAAQAVTSVSCGIIAEANHGTTADSLAWAAYDIADAMLKARLSSPHQGAGT
jgi:hypothetical protein